jgi:hypothetical protein
MKHLLLSILLCCATGAMADTIDNVSGSFSAVSTESFGDLSVGGANWSGYFSSNFDGPLNFGPLSCTSSNICSFSYQIGGPICEYAAPCEGQSGGSYGNKQANWVTGGITITGHAYYSGSGQFVMPISITGDLAGYDISNCSPEGYACTLGPEIFNENFTGKGTVTLGVSAGTVYTLSGNFTGGTVPEPAPIAMLGAGLISLGFFARKKLAA